MTESEKLDILINSMALIKNKVDTIELKQDMTSKKINELQLDVKIAERDIRRDIHTLKDEMETVVEVLKRHELIPQ